MINHQIIQNLKNSSEVTLDELSDQLVDRAESKQMMREVFPPNEYGYDRLDSEKLKSARTKTDEEYYHEVNDILTKYAPQSKPSARAASDSFQIQLELQQAQEELDRLNREIEENKIRELEQAKIQQKVRNQRKARKQELKRKEEEAQKKIDEEKAKAQEERK